jgi:hypothetical protein
MKETGLKIFSDGVKGVANGVRAMPAYLRKSSATDG